jgi:hypothetical protein
LSGARFRTQFEMTHSTETSGSGILSIMPMVFHAWSHHPARTFFSPVSRKWHVLLMKLLARKISTDAGPED